MSQKHHPFSPSTMGRRAHCRGSYRMERDMPELPSKEAEEGTLLHEAVAEMIRGPANGNAHGGAGEGSPEV